MEIELYLKNEHSTQNLGHAIADSIPHDYIGLIVSLIGEMGAGKTTLVRSLLRSLGHKGNVPSPTYTLIEPYEFERGKIFHIDLYRINDQSELEFLGWNDLFEDGNISPESFLNAIKDKNLLKVGNSLDVIAFGFKVGKNFISFNPADL